LENLPNQGPKVLSNAKNGMVSTSHPEVTKLMVDVLKNGGNAVDAAIAGSLAGPVYEPHMTTHSGTVSFLYWDASSGKAYFMDAAPKLPNGLKPFNPFPDHTKSAAAIPGSIPGLKAMAERFGTKKWSYYVQPAIKAAEEGHVVTSWEYALLYGGTGGVSSTLSGRTYFSTGRDHFTPNGFQVPVGQLWKRPDLAKTLKKIAEEGPEYCIKGKWAEHLVETANILGWKITLEDIASYNPLWIDPIKFKYKDHELIGIPPPQRGGFYSGFTLGILEEFDLKKMGHYTESAESLALIAWALRRAHFEKELIHDLEYYNVPTQTLLSKDYLKIIANIWRESRPIANLSNYLKLTHGEAALLAGLPFFPKKVNDSCELSVVDKDGNWVEMMETGGGGIPGVVVDGIPGSSIGWERYAVVEPGGRTQHAIANTFVLQNGKPWMAIGSPGDCIFTVPEVLLNILEYDMDPYTAVDMPRFWPLADDYSIEIENRISSSVVKGLQERGILVRSLGTYHWPMGSMQIVWNDVKTNQYCGLADPRRLGKAEGY
jgi:gamma-glutamyltranspeptidase/glutathione hydrolase